MFSVSRSYILAGAGGVLVACAVYLFAYRLGYSSADKDHLQADLIALKQEVEQVRQAAQRVQLATDQLRPIYGAVMEGLDAEHSKNPDAFTSMSDGSLQLLNSAVRDANRLTEQFQRLPSYR